MIRSLVQWTQHRVETFSVDWHLARTELLRDRDEIVAVTLQSRRADPVDRQQANLVGRRTGGDEAQGLVGCA